MSGFKRRAQVRERAPASVHAYFDSGDPKMLGWRLASGLRVEDAASEGFQDSLAQHHQSTDHFQAIWRRLIATAFTDQADQFLPTELL